MPHWSLPRGIAVAALAPVAVTIFVIIAAIFHLVPIWLITVIACVVVASVAAYAALQSTKGDRF